MRRKKLFISLLAILTVLLMALQSFAFEGVSDLKNKLNDTNSKKSQVTQDKRQNEKEQKEITQKIEKLQSTIQNLESEIKNLNGNIVDTKNKIEVTQGELVVAEENIGDKKDTLNSRLNVMYKNGDVGYVEVLLDSNNFEDLLTRVDMVKKIFNHDVDLIKYLKEQRDLIEIKKNTLESQKAELVALLNNEKRKQENLKVSRGQMQRAKEQLVKDHKVLESEEDKLNDLAKKLEKEIMRKQSSAKYTGGKMSWPAPGYKTITSPYGYRVHPILKKKKLHTGIDIRVPSNNNIVAAQSGTVIHAGWLGGYGKVVMIDHGGGIVTLYAHNNKLLVKEGQKVTKQQSIAKSGSTGMSTGPHLHFEVRENGKYVNPIQSKYIK
ncbi:peptidoglycan DD-metalloendopeptidase family protein [Wukongibacter baidiensis]|uniref:murein hydrolase activator EnvC family protein n=1 Tax=Wukongibacter baidiensis TaxID=1723361 RepID=UPI003D7FA4FE